MVAATARRVWLIKHAICPVFANNAMPKRVVGIQTDDFLARCKERRQVTRQNIGRYAKAAAREKLIVMNVVRRAMRKRGPGCLQRFPPPNDGHAQTLSNGS